MTTKKQNSRALKVFGKGFGSLSLNQAMMINSNISTKGGVFGKRKYK